MSAAATKGQQLRTVEETVEDLLSPSSDFDFTRARLLRAVQALRSLAPSIEIDRLSRAQIGTDFVFECSAQDAAKLVGHERLPKLPSRVSYAEDWLYRVRRVRGGRVEIRGVIDDTTPAPLSAFTPTAINAMAPPDLAVIPDSPQAWRAALLREVEGMLNCAHDDTFERWLRSSLMLTHMLRHLELPKGASDDDRAAAQVAIDAANKRFGMAEADIQHVVALHRRLHGELCRAVLEAVERAPVEDRGQDRARGPRLVVDNTRD
jgi:hypothetical protein